MHWILSHGVSIALTALLAIGCSTKREATEAVRESRADYKLTEARRDMTVKDSVRIVERGDTVRVERWVREQILEVRVDTVVVVRTRDAEREAVSVVQSTPNYIRFVRWLGVCIAGLALAYLLYKWGN